MGNLQPVGSKSTLGPGGAQTWRKEPKGSRSPSTSGVEPQRERCCCEKGKDSVSTLLGCEQGARRRLCNPEHREPVTALEEPNWMARESHPNRLLHYNVRGTLQVRN